MVRYLLIAAALTLSLSSVSGMSGQQPGPPVGHHLDHLREGDLVLRKGRGWRAQVVRTASAYAMTHVGLLVANGYGGWNVIHAAPPEDGITGSVRAEPLLHFASADQAQEIVFLRITDDRALITRVVAIVREQAKQRTPFDDAFDLGDQHRLYCTELIWWALNRAGHPLSLRLTHVAAGVFGGEFLTPRDLIDSGHFKPVEASIR